MRLQDMLPAPDERLFMCGMSGSGKSTLMRRLMGVLPPDELTIILDSKPEYEPRRWWQRWKQSGPLVLPPRVPLKVLDPGVYVLQTEYPDWGDPRVTPVMLAMLKRKNCTLIIDEFADYCRHAWTVPAIAKAIREGRKKNVRMMIGTQRPADIALVAITEANKVACFRLRRPEDRKRMADYADPQMLQPVKKYWFWWQDSSNDERESAILINGTTKHVPSTDGERANPRGEH